MKLNHNHARIGALLISLFSLQANAADPGGVVLDEAGVKNLGIETITAEETRFVETAFALGRIESIPTRAGSVSSRISGKLVELNVAVGDIVKAGETVAKVESRQPGDPPPVISMTSPVKGIVMRADSRLGDPVEPDRAIVEITDLSEVYAVSRVPEYQAGLLKPGTKAVIKVAALGDKKFEGTLLRFGTVADQQSGTIDAIFTLPNEDLSLRPGMRAEFDITLSVRENVLAVPKTALQGNPASRHVYVKDISVENAFVKAPVQVGKKSGDQVEILGGIFPGDEVVTRGSYALGFAGGGAGMSIKEALDAAHGHDHNEDGSEMSPEQAAAKKAGGGGEGHDDHPAKSSGPGMRELIFMISTGILAVLLVVTTLMQRKSLKENTQPG